MYYMKLACNPCKCMSAFKIKNNFYYKNINNQSFKKKKACNTQIRINTFKIKYNFYHKNINNLVNFCFF